MFDADADADADADVCIVAICVCVRWIDLPVLHGNHWFGSIVSVCKPKKKKTTKHSHKMELHLAIWYDTKKRAIEQKNRKREVHERREQKPESNSNMLVSRKKRGEQQATHFNNIEYSQPVLNQRRVLLRSGWVLPSSVSIASSSHIARLAISCVHFICNGCVSVNVFTMSQESVSLLFHSSSVRRFNVRAHIWLLFINSLCWP